MMFPMSMGMPGFGMGVIGMGMPGGLGMPGFGMGMGMMGMAMPGMAMPMMGIPGMGMVGPMSATAPPRVSTLKDLYKPSQRGSAGPPPFIRAADLSNPRALLEAADKADEQLCRALVTHSDFKFINEKSENGRTAVHMCVLKKLPEDLCLSILNHKDFKEVNAVDAFGNTLLICAASKGMTELCMAILARQDFTGVNVQDKWGATVLHWAADLNLGGVCEAVLSHPKFVEATRRAWSFAFEDKTALEVAVNRKCTAAAEVIRRHLNKS